MWDLVADSSIKEFEKNGASDLPSMPANHIMVYLIQANRFRSLCDEYP